MVDLELETATVKPVAEPTVAIEVAGVPTTRDKMRRMATRCLICDRPLCDATSVTVGVGPECRKKTGLKADGTGKAEANAIIVLAAIAAEDGNVAEVLRVAAELRDRGWAILADRIYERFVDIRVASQDGRLLVRTPYSPAWNEVAYRRRIGSWFKPLKARVVQTDRLPELLEALGEVWPGKQALGPAGEILTLVAPLRPVPRPVCTNQAPALDLPSKGQTVKVLRGEYEGFSAGCSGLG